MDLEKLRPSNRSKWTSLYRRTCTCATCATCASRNLQPAQPVKPVRCKRDQRYAQMQCVAICWGMCCKVCLVNCDWQILKDYSKIQRLKASKASKIDHLLWSHCWTNALAMTRKWYRHRSANCWVTQSHSRTFWDAWLYRLISEKVAQAKEIKREDFHF